jgi:hypothetical protein
MTEQGTVISTAVFILALVTVSVWLWNVIPHKEKLKRLRNREEFTSDEIYSRFFADKNLPKGLVLGVWNEVADSLRLPKGKLRPSDRFDKELAPVKGWEYDDDIVEVIWAAQHQIKESGATFDLSKIQTLGDYVEFFCRLELGSRQSDITTNEISSA